MTSRTSKWFANVEPLLGVRESSSGRVQPPCDIPEKTGEAEPTLRVEGRISPDLRGRIDAEPELRERVIFLYDGKRPAAPFPSREGGEASADLLAEYRERLVTADAERRQRLSQFGASRVRSLPIVDAISAEIALGNVSDVLAEEPSLVWVEPETIIGRVRRSVAPAAGTVADARKLLRSDPFRVFKGGSIALLDTGVWAGHALIDPQRLAFNVEGSDDGSDTIVWTPYSGHAQHGTASAAIISGSAAMGPDHEGVSEITVMSFRIYDDKGANARLTVEALYAARAASVGTILVETQEGDDDRKAVAYAADEVAQDTVVIAPVGNTRGVGTVAAPASAHRVLGVGAVTLDGLQPYNSQSAGPTSDGRVKPDLQGPTGTLTAAGGGTVTTGLYPLGGTSGAAPYIAAAAAMLRAAIGGQVAGDVPPGVVYAFLLAAGRSAGIISDIGVGLPRLPDPARLVWGEATVLPTMWHSVTIDLLPGSPALDVAAWWPEAPEDGHNDVDLFVTDDQGGLVAYSREAWSVFERLRVVVPNPAQPSSWTIWLHGYALSGPQQVYWAAIGQAPPLI